MSALKSGYIGHSGVLGTPHDFLLIAHFVRFEVFHAVKHYLVSFHHVVVARTRSTVIYYRRTDFDTEIQTLFLKGLLFRLGNFLVAILVVKWLRNCRSAYLDTAVLNLTNVNSID